VTDTTTNTTPNRWREPVLLAPHERVLQVTYPSGG